MINIVDLFCGAGGSAIGVERIENTNKAIKYDSYHDMLRNLPYLLDDNHRDIMLTGYVNEQIQKAKEQSKVKELDDWER